LTFAEELRNFRRNTLVKRDDKTFQNHAARPASAEKKRENEKLRQQTLQRVLDLLPQLAAGYGFHVLTFLDR